MRTLILLVLGTMVLTAGMSQSSPTSVSYKKATRPALTLLLPYSEEIAEGTIVQKLKEIGYDPETKGALFWKKNTMDGYYIFKNVALRNLNGRTVDLYFKVDRKSRKEKEQSNITMLVANGEERFVSSESESQIFESATEFLNGFTSHSATYKLNVDVQAQQSVLKAAEAKYTRLQEDEKALIKKIKELEENLKSNRQNQETQVKVIEAEKIKLEDLRAKI